ncbi:hypothetical protein [Primorskyibacter sp. 2E233]|uniref:hypothetical protein n=1 Tax=Primorskyibacter sp. 2E233 TaxID=3413431 RepID=UPI003BF04F55
MFLLRHAATLVATLLTLGAPQFGQAGSADMLVLQSASGDQVQIQERIGPGCDHVPCPVRLCLENPSYNSGAKALSNRRLPPPEASILSGQAGCITVAAVRQSLVLWRQGAAGGLVPALVAPLDLRGKAGRLIFLEWLVEAPMGALKQEP